MDASGPIDVVQIEHSSAINFDKEEWENQRFADKPTGELEPRFNDVFIDDHNDKHLAQPVDVHAKESLMSTTLGLVVKAEYECDGYSRHEAIHRNKFLPQQPYEKDRLFRQYS